MERLCILICCIGFFLTNISGCSNDSEPLVKVDGDTAERASRFVQDYKETLVDSVNHGHFNDLEPFLITNNSFYHSLRRYVSELQREQVKKVLISFEVENVYKGDGERLFVDAIEVVELNENGQTSEENRQVRFEIIEDKIGKLRVVTITQQKT